MWNIQQTKTNDTIRELTLDELNAVSGGDGNTPNDPNLPKLPSDCEWWNPFC
jgi:hypothetical protein